MASLRRWPVLTESVGEPAMEGLISTLNYRQYAGEITMMFVREPEEVSPQLMDLKQAIAGTARALKEEGPSTELVGVQNSLICMDDALKAYEEHHLEVPKQLIAIRRHLEQRCNEIAPQL